MNRHDYEQAAVAFCEVLCTSTWVRDRLQETGPYSKARQLLARCLNTQHGHADWTGELAMHSATPQQLRRLQVEAAEEHVAEKVGEHYGSLLAYAKEDCGTFTYPARRGRWSRCVLAVLRRSTYAGPTDADTVANWVGRWPTCRARAGGLHAAAKQLFSTYGTLPGYLPEPPVLAPPAQVHSATSVAAAASVAGRRAAEMRAKVHNALRDCGQNGATDEELQALSGLPGNSVRPRRVELVRMGVVRDSGRTRATQRGRQAVVWLWVAGQQSDGQSVTCPVMRASKDRKALALLRTELDEAYAELAQQAPALHAVFNRAVWDRVQDWYTARHGPLPVECKPWPTRSSDMPQEAQ